jgi:hypothetical protein
MHHHDALPFEIASNAAPAIGIASGAKCEGEPGMAELE